MDGGNLSSRQTGTLHAFESYQRKFSDWTCVKRSTLLETDWSQGARLGRRLIQWSRQAGITSLVPLLPSSSCMCAWRSTPNPPNFGISSAQIELRSCVLWTCPHSTERSDLLSISATRNYGVFSLLITTPHLPTPVTWCNGRSSILELNGLAPLLPSHVTLGKLLRQSSSFLIYKVRIIHLCIFFFLRIK